MSSSISVAVRVRPFSEKERLQLNSNHDAGPTLFNSDASATPTYTTPQPARGPGSMRKVLKVLDERILVFDPPDTNAVASFQRSNMPLMGKKVKDIRFCFDRVFDEDCGQEKVYDGSAKELVSHVMDGFHSTVFAYGATGCGKTHTISGSPTQPGIVFLIMKDLFARIAAKSDDVDFSLTVSYLEIYNETIRDLLAPESGVLQLRDSQDGMATPANLSTKEPTCAQDVVEWITLGNGNRTVNFTEANATSSRSHAVLRVTVTQKLKAGGLTDTKTSACLSVIDLAGSERASVTKNRGERLTEGANINRSLLALGNCINALCDPRKRGHVPYRDSKLTRLLKQSLGGNCKTVMIVCVSPSSTHYDETHNTLQYANRAKEIKTKAIRNVISVDRHVAQYCQQIMEQAQQIERLKAELATKGATSAQEDRVEDERAVSQAVARLHGSWDSGKVKRVAAEKAAAEKSVLDGVLRTLRQWQLTALSTVDAGSPGGSSAAAAGSTTTLLKQECQDLVADLTARSVTLQSESSSADGAFDPYIRAVASAKTNLRARPAALSSFTYEARLLDSYAETAAADARAQGVHAGFALQSHTMRKMLDTRVKVGVALESALEVGSESARALARLASGVDKANHEAFAAFAGESAGPLFSSTATLLAAGTKRDSGARSPLIAENPSWDKVPRLGLSGLGSAPTGSMAPSPMRARRSPKKDVSSQALSKRAASPGKKGKGVQWRDELGDGWELEDVKYGSPDVSLLGDTSFPAIAVTSPGPSSRMWTASSTFAESSESSKAAELMAQKARSASSGSRSKLSSTPNLSSVSESSTPFSFAPSPPSASSASSSADRSPFAELGNASLSASTSSTASYSMAPTPNGLVAPIIASSKPSSLFPTASSFTGGPPPTPGSARRPARRTSHIGPLRVAKTRRSSFAAPLPPPASSSHAGDSSFASSAANLSLPLTSSNPIPLRKPGRVSSAPGAGPPPSASSGSSRHSLLPNKSPRKLLPHAAGRTGAASRRLSTLPSIPASFGRLSGGGAAGGLGGAGATTPAPVPFGQKSAARIAARRASSLTGSGNNSGSGAAALGLPLSKKDSPSGVWR